MQSRWGELSTSQRRSLFKMAAFLGFSFVPFVFPIRRSSRTGRRIFILFFILFFSPPPSCRLYCCDYTPLALYITRAYTRFVGEAAGGIYTVGRRTKSGLCVCVCDSRVFPPWSTAASTLASSAPYNGPENTATTSRTRLSHTDTHTNINSRKKKKK